MAKLGPYMLIYEQDCNVLSVVCVSVKCLLDRAGLGLGVDDEEVLLGVWWLGNMLIDDISTRLIPILLIRRRPMADVLLFQRVASLSRNPAIMSMSWWTSGRSP